mmetsp:Transcript_5611/g.8356  ORF Transcript_5611/g.8356 Transcript_5611/m.8356 type:complete len:135 (-) Transcript_5611:152-556(-)
MSILSKTIVAALFGCYYVASYASAFVNHRHSSHITSIVKHTRSRYPITIFNSADNNNDTAEDSENSRSETNDPDGVPLFDTNDRATLFGLEPNAEMDPLDGLQFTGPLIMFLSIYVTLSLFFAGEGELVLFDNI